MHTMKGIHARLRTMKGTHGRDGCTAVLGLQGLEALAPVIHAHDHGRQQVHQVSSDCHVVLQNKAVVPGWRQVQVRDLNDT
jgi:hypothetical protein